MAHKRAGISRRDFIGKSAAIGFSPILLNSLWTMVGCGRAEFGSAEFMIADDVLKKAVGILMSKGADFGDIYVEAATFEGISNDDRKINTSTTIEKGVGIRAVKDDKTFFAYTDSFTAEEIYKTAQFVADAASDASIKASVTVVDLTVQSSSLTFQFIPDPCKIAVEKKIELVQGLSERAWSADSRVNQVSQSYNEIMRYVNIATSSGSLIAQTLGLTEWRSAIYMKDDTGQLQRGTCGRAAYAGRNFFEGENSFESVVDKSVERAKKLLEAVDSPRGVFPVILGPGDPAVIFHEACGHGMEADLVYKGSNYKDQLGKQTAAKGVTLVDDGTIPQMPGSFAFDDEGTPSQRTVLIDDGVQANYLCDLIWAQKLGIQSTGSGRRQSFRYPPLPRMRNTFIDNGTVPAADIIAETKRGVYI